MKTPLALHNLWHQGRKTIVSIVGVAFALLLVFMQLGFMGAVSHTATNVLETLRFDILIRAPEYVHLYEPGQIDRRWLTIAEGSPGIVAARPLWISIQNWRTLPTARQAESGDFENRFLPIAVMAFDPRHSVFRLPELEEMSRWLHHDDALLIDGSTQSEYGPWQAGRFSSADIGRETEIGGQQFVLRGLFQLGTGLAANGAVITGKRGFARVSPWDVERTASLGLVKIDADDLRRPAEILDGLKQRLALAEPGISGELPRRLSTSPESTVPTAVQLLTRDQALESERRRWLWQTPIGLIFQLGVVLALLVGAAIVYMILATDVADRLPEYATLLAMGYSRRYLSGIVITQAMVLSGLGFVVAWLAAEVLYRLAQAFSGIPLTMLISRILLVAALGVVMCLVSGLLALRKLWRAEPASLF